MTREEKYWLIHKIIDGILYKQCSKCKEWRPETNEYYYYVNKSKPEKGLVAACKSCMSLNAINYQNKHIEKRRKWQLEYYYKEPKREKQCKNNSKKSRLSGKQKIWQQNHKEKLKQYNLHRQLYKNHKITKEEWIACKNYFNNCCAYCGLPIENHWIKRNGKLVNYDLHKEHVINGGRNDIKNCVPSCQSCNSKKNRKTINEFLKCNDNNGFNYEKYHKIYLWIRYDCKKYKKQKCKDTTK